MKKILIATSAFSNPDLLLKCVASWPRHPNVDAVVYFDGLNYQDSVFIPLPENVKCICPNPPEHKGCSGSWNRLLDYWYVQTDAEYILVVGSDTTMTKPGADLILKELSETTLDFGDVRGMGYNAWFLSRKGYEEVGTFDENFYPAYFEDKDYQQRVIRTTNISNGSIAKVGTMNHAKSQTIRKNKHYEAASNMTYVMNRHRYIQKWGGEQDRDGTEKYKTPYNDPTCDLKHWVLDEADHMEKFRIWNP